MNSVDTARTVVRFGRRQTKGLLLGLSALQLAALAVATLTVSLCSFAAGGMGLIISSPVWGGCLAAALIRRDSCPVVDALPTVLHWWLRRARGQSAYRRSLSTPRPAGTLALPGDAAALRFHVDQPTGIAMVHDPHRRTMAAVLRVSHPAFVMLAPEEQDNLVASWGRVLAGLAADGSCAAVQITEASLPDPGDGVRDWYRTRGVHDGAWPATEYGRLLTMIAPTTSRHRTLITLTLDLTRVGAAIRGPGGGMQGSAHVLLAALGALAASLRAADLRVDGWLSAHELADIIEGAYDPGAARAASTAGRSLSTAGPLAVDEQWDHLRHDSAVSAVLWIRDWPRSEVRPDFLHSVVFEPGIRKTFCMVATPLSAVEALRAIRKEKVEYVTESHQHARLGRLADLGVEQEYLDVLGRERALAAGHADMRFSGFLTVTAASRDELSRAVGAVSRAAVHAGCETRVLYGKQAQAFVVAALPLGRAPS